MSSQRDFVPEVTPPRKQADDSVAVESVDDDIFLGKKDHLYKPPMARGVYGGQVIGQALMAAAQTVPPDIPLLSFHCYFLLSGSPDRDIVYNVKRHRDGRSFFTRSVVAIQNGKSIFTLNAQFSIPEPSRGLQYHDPIPSGIFTPDQLMDIAEYWRCIADHSSLQAPLKEYIDRAMNRPVTISQKIVHRSFLKTTDQYRDELLPHLWPLMVGDGKPQRFIWMKAHSDLPETTSLNVHKCVIAFMSDMAFIPTAMEPLYGPQSGLGKRPKIGMTVTLDHSMWFHSPSVKADEWLLFGMYCHVTGGSRALLTCKVWNTSGELVLSVTQGALIRLQDETVSKL
jgi:acyl-CoA thioesterase II